MQSLSRNTKNIFSDEIFGAKEKNGTSNEGKKNEDDLKIIRGQVLRPIGLDEA